MLSYFFIYKKISSILTTYDSVPQSLPPWEGRCA
jgi:hypothetical protein